MRGLGTTSYFRRMKTSYRPYLSILMLTTIIATDSAYALDEDECSLMVRGCLSRPTNTRDVCFESASAAPACIGSLIGEITSKRSHFAPVAPGDEDEGPAFLGPRMVDRSCLESFDRQLELALDLGPLTAEQRRTLSSQLDRCGQEAPSNLYRP